MSDQGTDFSEFLELTSPRLGTRTLQCSDDFFAPMENLLKPEPPVFIADKYTDRGKWMDGWESRRKREPGHDWCVIGLGVRGVVRGVVIDTSHFTGNHPESASIEGRLEEAGGTGAPGDDGWVELLPRSPLRGNSLNVFTVENAPAVSLLRLNIHPDGGVARLRVFGEPVPDWERLAGQEGPIDLASAALGARVLSASNMHFGSRHNLIMPGPAADMRDGWETRRRRGPGHDWCLIRLAAEGTIRRVEVDTTHFKGNFPESCSLEACLAGTETMSESAAGADWATVLQRTKLRPDSRHFFEQELGSPGAVDHARFNIYPDGGVSRLRLWGELTAEGWVQTGLRSFNAAFARAAEERLLQCCASSRWARQLTARRPFPDLACLQTESDEVWMRLEADDYLEAFSAHPRIGETQAGHHQPERAAQWSSDEQAGAASADEGVKAELAEANRFYEQRFGFVFIVCASGKSAPEMLEILRRRLDNDRESEIANAAEEQRKITQLRLEKLFLP